MAKKNKGWTIIEPLNMNFFGGFEGHKSDSE
jgi:hypothetical protein